MAKKSRGKRKPKPRIPETYAEVPGCHNCKHCFVFYEYEDGNQYYCKKNAPRRPRCGSVAMGECPRIKFTDAGERALRKLKDKWHDWSQDREVMPWGCCDKHELDPNKPHPPANPGVVVIRSFVTNESTTLTFSVEGGWDVAGFKKGKS